MKKLTALFAFLLLTAFCFANGTLEEKKRIEQRILSHPAVESVCLCQVNDDLIRNNNYWDIKIYIKNNRYLHISSNRSPRCTEENLSTGCFEVDRIGDYEFWNYYGGSDNWYLSGSKHSFTSILQIQLNCIEDYINNYEKILDFAKELSKETIEERTFRLRKIRYTDSEFQNYYGNYLSEDYWCKVFARYLPRDSKEYTDFFYPYKNDTVQEQ